MKLLIKIPSRNRTKKLFHLMDLYLSMVKDTINTSFLLSLDSDDTKLDQEELKEMIEFWTNLYGISVISIIGTSENKIHAVNRDIDNYTINYPWDVLVLASDDMLPIKDLYDEIIRNDMNKFAPDLDGVLYYPDGYTPLNTLPVMGKNYYNRFSYIYNPDYKSFFCDNEFHEVAERLGKHFKCNTVLFKHEHPANTNVPSDELYLRNNSSWEEDKKLYFERRLNNFGLGGIDERKKS